MKPEPFSAVMKFTHGEMEIKGTMIFILGTIAENEKREGFVSTKMSESLEEQLAASKQRVADRESKHN